MYKAKIITCSNIIIQYIFICRISIINPRMSNLRMSKINERSWGGREKGQSGEGIFRASVLQWSTPYMLDQH